MWRKFLFILVFSVLVLFAGFCSNTSKIEVDPADFNQMADYILETEKQLPILQVKLENLQNNLKTSETLYENTSRQVLKLQRTNKFLIGCCGVSLTVGIGALIYALIK